jgi:hypothetical protein
MSTPFKELSFSSLTENRPRNSVPRTASIRLLVSHSVIQEFIIIIIIIIITSCMQGIYTHTLETNYVPREYSVAAIL